jgi:hypothetical protein
MRGTERPAKVAWTRPFLPPLKPLEQAAARQILIDIADAIHEPAEVDKVLSLTGNMPLAVTLLAHLVDSEGCSKVLSRWKEETTALISEGYDRRDNLELSICLSLSSPRMKAVPHARDLLRILSVLPDGLSDVELLQSKFRFDILGSKSVLIRTALAYNDEHKRLKTLVPVREYIAKIQPPEAHLICPLAKYFQQLLELFVEFHGRQSCSAVIARITSNYSNIQNVLQTTLLGSHPKTVCTLPAI